MIKIKKGLDLPITGSPEQVIHDGNTVSRVAILGEDYIGMKPTMKVKEGDQVVCGQVLFVDKKNEGVSFTAPASGTISAINRGAKRKLLSVVIDIDGDDSLQFDKYTPDALSSLTKEQVTQNLVNSGLWTTLRTRPFSKVPAIGSTPEAIFVTAIDTHPLSADPAVIIKEEQDSFNHGLAVLKNLTEGKLHVCTAENFDTSLTTGEQSTFAGPHPAGLPGTHIHFLHGSSAENVVWHIGYQDVITVGKLFTEGKLINNRVVALGGPGAKKPRLVRTLIGADLSQLLENEVESGDIRIISGSVFSGTIATGARAFLGRTANQVSMLAEGREKEFFGWAYAGRKKFSVTRAFISHLVPSKKFDFTTTTGGSERAIMPIGSYERVMPLDVLPTQLLRALASGDTETAQQLGCLELDEEDLALCTFVCPGKYEYGPLLRSALETIEKDG
ncbi:Na(+)-translocating NADH-quinone reductase subunit A [Pleionea sp. CnH1-48]|uniref:Na(+)-translocating NADH-quinone reductase subunit A n=1 Tax=Pleionea sp. CnH1-48 TaxID=2954494 RepID=UPI002098324A|nr:Na(+)-translocating NADH-quinone reductase subunit A [Pleionea sp. CnH1-48]MCO7225074.1 Na(+)-translocating NADH-quinone reductase subunit A [Pleionea sp. CnH1-48]